MTTSRRRRRRFVAERCRPDAPGFINTVSVCELVWVLHRVHGYDRRAVGAILIQLVVSDDILVEEHDLVRSAVSQFQTGKAGFADVLIGMINRKRGCESTATFDREPAKVTGFILVA